MTAETAYCACGYRFESDAAGERPSSDLVAQAEALYESHLRARLQRAVRATRFAKFDVLHDPRNSVKTAQLRMAEKEVEILETQVTVQSVRAAATRAATAHPRAELALVQTTLVTTEAPKTFRAAQSTRAEQTFELIRLQLALERLRSTQTTAVFKAVQAEKARGLAERIEAVQTCPGCGNAIKAGTKRCDCGYVLSATSTDAASGFLTAEELAALRDNT